MKHFYCDEYAITASHINYSLVTNIQ